MTLANHKVTRRKFVTTTMAIGIGTGVSSVRAETNVPRSLASNSDPGYFDMHLHMTQAWFGADRGPLTASALLHWMDAHHISQGAILPLVSPEAFWYPITSEFVLRETAPHRDRLIPFCAIDPRSLDTHLTDQKQLVEMLSRYRDAGARGFGEHKALLAIDDPLNMRLYEACEEVGLPVLFHLDNKANMDAPGLPGLAKVLRTFPGLTMIGHGKGWWSSIAGGLSQADLHVGYPRGPVAPGGAIDQLMDEFPNIYGDLSSSGAHAIFRDEDFGQKFLRRRADRLLFGTDYYDLLQRDFPHFELLGAFDLPPEIKQKIARDNARRVLGLT